MKRTIAFLTGIAMLFCAVPAFPVTAGESAAAEQQEDSADDYIYYWIYVTDPPPGSSPDAVRPPSSVTAGSAFTLDAVVTNNREHPIRKINPGTQGDVSWNGWDDWQGEGSFQEYIPLRFTCKTPEHAGIGKTTFGAVLGNYIMTEDGEYLDDWKAWARMEFEVYVMESEEPPDQTEVTEPTEASTAPQPDAPADPIEPESKLFVTLKQAMEQADEEELLSVRISYRDYQKSDIDMLVEQQQREPVEIMAELYQKDGTALTDALGIPQEQIIKISRDRPFVCCKLTKAQIREAAEREEVRLIILSEPRRFIVLNKTYIPPYGEQLGYRVLSLIEIPLQVSDIAFSNNGQGLPTYTITDSNQDDVLFVNIVAEAEYGDVLEADVEEWGQAAIAPWTPTFRMPLEVYGGLYGVDRFEIIGNALTDEGFADYRSICNGKTVLTFTSQEGSRYLAFPGCLKTEVPFVAESNLPDLGDINEDGAVNASDAAVILQIAALVGAGSTAEELAQSYQQRLPFADANGDGYANASDAALVLQYAAYHGAQRAVFLDFRSYLQERDHTVMRVSVGYDENSKTTVGLFTSAEELERYFTEERTPMEIGTTDSLLHRDADEVRAEILAAYPAAFFETHHLAVLSVHEANTDTCQLIRKIRQNEDGTVTIDLHHLEIGGQPLEGNFAVLVAVDKSITDPAQIRLNETYECR